MAHLRPLVAQGLKSILIFGVIETLPKNKEGSSADCPTNPVVRALPVLRQAFPNLVLACDVCLCPYTADGHCGLIREAGPAAGSLDNDASIVRIAEIAVAYAKHGAHIVAPSDMMDNRIASIRKGLDASQLEGTAILSYSCKFASNFYGPFREAAKSAPSFGDRKTYQLPIGGRGLALRAAKRDLAEGANYLMVKPGLAYLDIVRGVKDQHPDVPLFIYQVSGEYTMLYNSAQPGTPSFNGQLMEILQGMRRAGGDVIISYFVPYLFAQKLIN